MNQDHHHLTRAPALQSGDRVHIISPAGPVVAAILEAGIATLESWGLEVVVDEAVFGRRPPYDYLAGDDEARHRAFMTAWRDPLCRAVFCSRGGYGTMRILPLLDLDELRAQPRLLVGFSDITALHLYLAGVGGLPTLHGPVLKSIPLHDDDPFESVHRLRDALFATDLAPRPWQGMKKVRPGRVTGPVLGGNLSLIVAMLGSPYCPCLDGAILIVEDIDEVDYRLDRLFTALRLAGGDRLGGLILGDFSGCHGVYVDEDRLQPFLEHLAADFDCPVAMNAPVGHSSRNVAFPMGLPAEFDADAGTLTFSNHAVAHASQP